MKDYEKNAFSKRLNELCEDKEIPKHGRQTRISKIFKTSQEAARKWLQGESVPKYENMVIMCDYFGCFFEWLATGKGVKYRNNTAEQILESLGIDINNLDNDQKESIQIISKLPIEERRRVKKIIKTLSEPNGNGEDKESKFG